MLKTVFRSHCFVATTSNKGLKLEMLKQFFEVCHQGTMYSTRIDKVSQHISLLWDSLPPILSNHFMPSAFFRLPCSSVAQSGVESLVSALVKIKWRNGMNGIAMILIRFLLTRAPLQRLCMLYITSQFSPVLTKNNEEGGSDFADLLCHDMRHPIGNEWDERSQLQWLHRHKVMHIFNKASGTAAWCVRE
jgi:hypothetical protein